MWFPTVEEIVDMHDRIIDRTGGETGVLRRSSLEAAIARARSGPFTQNGSLAERAGFLLRGIAQDHPFVDGNKRTGYAAADLFLSENGVTLDADEDEIVAFMVQVARGLAPLPEIVAWIERHGRRR